MTPDFTGLHALAKRSFHTFRQVRHTFSAGLTSDAADVLVVGPAHLVSLYDSYFRIGVCSRIATIRYPRFCGGVSLMQTAIFQHMLRRWATRTSLSTTVGTVRIPHLHGGAGRAGRKAGTVAGCLAPVAKHRSVGYPQHVASSQSQGANASTAEIGGRP